MPAPPTAPAAAKSSGTPAASIATAALASVANAFVCGLEVDRAEYDRGVADARLGRNLPPRNIDLLFAYMLGHSSVVGAQAFCDQQQRKAPR